MKTRDKDPRPDTDANRLGAVVDDPDAPPSEEELAESARLREALEDASKPHPGAELARAASLAYEPRPIDPAEHRAIVERALVKEHARSRGQVIRVTFGVVTAVVALAAGVVAVVRFTGTGPSLPRGTPPPALAVARSTQPLFTEPFAPVGGESARIDRIAMARAGDLRQNRFTKWGVR
jgi:hypothetical protein